MKNTKVMDIEIIEADLNEVWGKDLVAQAYIQQKAYGQAWRNNPKFSHISKAFAENLVEDIKRREDR